MIDHSPEYPYQVKVSYSNAIPSYYNSGHYMLCDDPDKGTRYKTKEVAEKDLDHAMSQGGKASVTLWIDNKNEYINFNNENYKLSFISDDE